MFEALIEPSFLQSPPFAIKYVIDSKPPSPRRNIVDDARSRSTDQDRLPHSSIIKLKDRTHNPAHCNRRTSAIINNAAEKKTRSSILSRAGHLRKRKKKNTNTGIDPKQAANWYLCILNTQQDEKTRNKSNQKTKPNKKIAKGKPPAFPRNRQNRRK